uniref:CDI domain-containing protein n=1 Tax=Steinernema glaseri TaxID=37863 RepID=A0A1I7Z3I0_9BILA
MEELTPKRAATAGDLKEHAKSRVAHLLSSQNYSLSFRLFRTQAECYIWPSTPIKELPKEAYLLSSHSHRRHRRTLLATMNGRRHKGLIVAASQLSSLVTVVCLSPDDNRRFGCGSGCGDSCIAGEGGLSTVGDRHKSIFLCYSFATRRRPTVLHRRRLSPRLSHAAEAANSVTASENLSLNRGVLLSDVCSIRETVLALPNDRLGVCARFVGLSDCGHILTVRCCVRVCKMDKEENNDESRKQPREELLQKTFQGREEGGSKRPADDRDSHLQPTKKCKAELMEADSTSFNKTSEIRVDYEMEGGNGRVEWESVKRTFRTHTACQKVSATVREPPCCPNSRRHHQRQYGMYHVRVGPRYFAIPNEVPSTRAEPCEHELKDIHRKRQEKNKRGPVQEKPKTMNEVLRDMSIAVFNRAVVEQNFKPLPRSFFDNLPPPSP